MLKRDTRTIGLWVAFALLTTVAQAQDPLVTKLKNASYRCGKQMIRLKDGYKEHPVSGGIAGFTELDTETVALAIPGAATDLVAAVVLRQNGGGNAVVLEVHALRLAQGGLQDVASVRVGGGGVKALAVENGTVKVTELSYGPDDPRCCPSVASTKTYRVSGPKLVPVLPAEEVDAHLQNFESAVTNLAAVEMTMALDPQAVYAMDQLNGQARRHRAAEKAARDQIRKADLIHDDRFLASARSRIADLKQVHDAAAVTFPQLAPGQQRAVLVAGQVQIALSRLIGK